MIAFGTCVGHPEKLKAHAEPGLLASMGSKRFVHWQSTSNGVDIFPIYAQLMKCAREHRSEALVLMHDDLEFRDPELADKIRRTFEDPTIAIIGLIGARHVTSLNWWEGDRSGRVEDLGYGLHDFGFSEPDVDSVDGMCLILSPWALDHLTLEGLGYRGFHGYDAELCFQARVKGKRVVVADIRAFHHSKGGFTQGLADADAVFQSRWSPHARMVDEVRAAGTDSLEHFGNGYWHEGGLYLQQNPDEFASLALLLAERFPGGSYLEIGSASGGACRFLSERAGFHHVMSIDDGKHPRAEHQGALLPAGTRRFTGDSHSAEARAWLEAEQAPDVAFIDGDHSYEGVTKDVAMVLPRCKPGALIVLHDTVACEGVKRAWGESLVSGKVKKVAEYIGTDKPLGIGVAEVVASRERNLRGKVPVSEYTYEERLRLALFKTVELLERSMSFDDPNATVPKFREEIRALAMEGPPILGEMSATVKAHSTCLK